MKTNSAATRPMTTTYEGGPAPADQSPLNELTRAVASCLLWEDTFYEPGAEIAARLKALCAQVTPQELSTLAVQAREHFKLRHVPLWLCRQLLRRHAGALAGETIAQIVRRPDEATELVALYWNDNVGGAKMLPKQLKRGLAQAFRSWDAYTLGKWNRSQTIKLRDVLFLSHAKPKDAEQGAVWKSLIDGTLPAPDTWEVALSAGGDPRQTWERLLRQQRLGYMALLMNLRNMSMAHVDSSLVEAALRDGAAHSWALPFRFVAAARAAPMYMAALSDAMLLAIGTQTLSGATALVIDVSGSMAEPISRRSMVSRWETATALGILLRGITPSCRIFTFSDDLVEVGNDRGLGLIAAVRSSQPHHGTYLVRALTELKHIAPGIHRVIVITDEQTHDGIIAAWSTHAYLINVGPYLPALDVRAGWTRISGWSERVVEWIRLVEEPDEKRSTA